MDPAVLQEVALSAAASRSLGATLGAIVQGLASLPDAALVRIWLKGPGDQCGRCPLRAECPDQTECLHLAASAGASRDEAAGSWNRLDGRFRRFPLGVRKVGRIAAGAKAELHRTSDGPAWFSDVDWAQREGIQTFAGHPLVFRDDCMGVLAMFSRATLGEDELVWLRTFSNQAAVAIANARAFEEIAELRRRVELERDYLREENRDRGAFDGIIGSSSALELPLSHVERVAPTDASVLILGESGTGKELFARAIHERSDRRDGPLVRVNCAAMPKELFESEFFGHQRGAFTGATSDRAGRFEIADGGTLFLDEVGEIPLELQSKLLRVLQEGQFERIGEAKTRKVDVRIVAATNRDLEREVASGRFRQDLYYRLSVFPLALPPLRERPEDVPDLARHFITRAARRYHRRAPELEPAQVLALQRYRWPGNIRELQNVIDRAVILSDGQRLPLEAALPDLRGDAAPAREPSDRIRTEAEIRGMEKANVEAALAQAGGKISGPGGAAELLGIKSTTLASRMRALGIRRD